MRKQALKQAWERLVEGRSFVIACHGRPDGDTLGSALALGHVLRGLGKDVVVISEDGVPDNYTFLPESDTVVTSTNRRDFEIGVLVDCEGTSRAGSAAEVIESAAKGACIDHHLPNNGFGEIRIIDAEASATAEVMVELFNANNVEMDEITANQLMIALIADTGGFRFANTRPVTFEVAAQLTAKGAKPAKIYREIFESKPLRSAKLLGRALGSLETDPSGKVIWATITQNDLDELGATDADTDSIVNQVGAVKGPSVAILFRETKPDVIRTSLRSRRGVDVDHVARAFGGGGHKAASGCTIVAPMQEAVRAVVAEVLKWTES